MNNDTKRLARKWAERKQKQAERHWEDSGYTIREDTQAAIKHVLATTPEPTMEDVEWEDKKHHLAGATTPDGDEVVMMWHDANGTGHIIADLGEGPRESLTPNGKRYELVEVTDKPEPADEPEHPETLETLEDYENAPDGTIVALPRTIKTWVKAGADGWLGSLGFRSSASMAGTPRTMLREGWGWVE